MKSFTWFTTLLLLCLELAHAAHVSRSGGGFPSLGFTMPSQVPSSLDGWWSDYKSDTGFLGVSYLVTQCQSPATLQSEFKDMRTRFNARYVRIEGGCDNDGFYDTIIDAAWDAGLGVQAMIWFDDDFTANKWQGRRDKLLGTLHTNPKAQFVTRALQFGSGPLAVSHFATPDLLADQINAAKKNLTSLGIPVTLSVQVAYYQANDGSQSVLDAIDFVDLVQLPYYSDDASIAFKSWPDITSDLEWVTSRVNGKKIMLSMNGWPQVTPPGTSDGHAVASLEQMVDYFVLFELLCSVLARNAGGGVAWFAGVYSVEQDPYLGILKNGQPQFSFSPPTSC